MITNKKLIYTGFAVFFLLFLAVPITSAAEENSSWVRIFSTKNYDLEYEFLAFDEKSKNGMDVSIADFDNDSVAEIVIAGAKDVEPIIKVFKNSGKLVSKFYAYAETFKKGINIAACDLDGSGYEKLVVGTEYGGGPQVRVFNKNGTIHGTAGFFAFPADSRNGVRVGCADTNGDGKDEILASSVINNQSQIKIFDNYGNTQLKTLYFKNGDVKRPLDIAGLDVGGDGKDEIMINLGYGYQPNVYLIHDDGVVIRNFNAYNESFIGGVNLTSIDFENDGQDEIITSPGFLGGPHVRVFDSMGEPTKTLGFFAFNKNLRGGIKTAAGNIDTDKDIEIVTVMDKLPWHSYEHSKYIQIDISDQYMEYYDYGFMRGRYQVSSGMPRLPTPLGTFKILSKSENAYSARYRLWMPHWMQFTSQGHGMHGLPYWIRNGVLIHEGVHDLGLMVSHGCVRVAVENAKILYQWADVGTTIFIKQ